MTRRHRCPVATVDTDQGQRYHAHCRDCEWQSADHVVKVGAADEARHHRDSSAQHTTQ